MKLTATPILEWLMQNPKRVRVLEGGSRSSKTYSILQYIILYCQDAQSRGEFKRATIARQKLTWLKATVLNDFIDILRSYDLYYDNDFHRSEMRYTLFGCEVAFFGLDEPQKLHGRKQDLFWINEAIEATKDDFDQLEMRTTEYCILDYNPSRTKHWIYDSVLSRQDAKYHHSTVMDNPFAPQAVIDKIISYEPTEANILSGTADENKWKIYGLGLRSVVEGLVFTNVSFVKEMPEPKWYGLDFGFTNDPTVLVGVAKADGCIYADELVCETGLTNSDISLHLEKHVRNKSSLIVADSAEQKSIAELRRLGWNIIGVTKGGGSVNIGIDILKRFKINITESSVNAKKEAENYTWRFDRATSSFINTPIDRDNHFWDALRYVAMECLGEDGVKVMPRKFGRSWRDAM